MQGEQEAHNDEEGLFKILNKKFKLQHNETIKSLQFHNLVRWHNESMGEWMGRLRTAAVECNYKEVHGQLKEQFTHRLNDSEILTDIIIEFTKSDENIMILSKHVFTWAKRTEAQRAQVAVFNSLHEV